MKIESEINAKQCLNVALKILAKWQCSQAQKRQILSHRDIVKRVDKSASPYSDEQLERIGIILNIHASLASLFSNKENIYGFMRFVNKNEPFFGRTPLSFIEKGDLQELRRVNHVIAKILKPM